jgi:hypothetical protein
MEGDDADADGRVSWDEFSGPKGDGPPEGYKKTPTAEL